MNTMGKKAKCMVTFIRSVSFTFLTIMAGTSLSAQSAGSITHGGDAKNNRLDQYVDVMTKLRAIPKYPRIKPDMNFLLVVSEARDIRHNDALVNINILPNLKHGGTKKSLSPVKFKYSRTRNIIKIKQAI